METDVFRNFTTDADKANHARFKTPGEFRRTGLLDQDFGVTALRHLLFAIHETARTENPREGLNYLKAARADYWARRTDLIAVAQYLAQARTLASLGHWTKDAEAAELLAGLMTNDHVGG